MINASHPFLKRNAPAAAAGGGGRFVRSLAALAVAVLLGLTQRAEAQPTVGAINVAGIMLCTNTDLTCTITSSSNTITITNVVLSYTTQALGGGNVNSVTTNVNSLTSGLDTTNATFSYPLVTNVMYTALTVTALDSTGASGSTNAEPSTADGTPPEVLDTLRPALVIEFEDYNYTNGGYMNTPADGGLALFTNEIGISEIDFNWATSAGPATGYYRQTDQTGGLGPQCENTGNDWALMPQKFWTALANGDTTDVPTEVGYNSTGNWLDFTRDFGSATSNSAPAGTYNIWAFGSDDEATVSEMFNLSLVTNSPTTSNQTTGAVLGSFSLTDANWNNYYYVPMLDQYGNLATVTLSGHETIRTTVTGQANQDFLMLIPAQPVLTPVLLNILPSTPFAYTSNLTFAVSAGQGAGIPPSGFSLVLNGENVSAGINLVGSTNSWVGTFTPQSNTLYSGTLSVANSAGLVSKFTVSFDTFDVNNYQFEAVDYDFSTNTGTSLPAIQGLETNAGWVSGLFIDNPEPTADITANLTGHLTNTSFFDYPTGVLPTKENGTNGAVAQQGVDVYFQTITDEQIGYRNDMMGAQPATDYVRPKFLAAQTKLNDPNIGQYNIGWTTSGDWENYTRHYPAGKYSIYARIAGNSAWSGSEMALVTNGFGTDTQEYTVLGTFADPNANGWQSYHWIPLVNSIGTPVGVNLEGQETLKFICGGGVNELFYMLVPYAAPTDPVLVSSYPDGSVPFQVTNVFSFEVTSQAGPAIANSGIGLLLNGVSVNGELTFDNSSTNTTVSIVIQSNMVYTAVINVTNASGDTITVTKSFDTFNVDNYTWEANDYDFTITNGATATSAQFIDNPIPTCETNAPNTGFVATNSYFRNPGGLTGTSGALPGVDFYDQAPQTIAYTEDYYRVDGQGSQISGDYLRPKFVAANTQFGVSDIQPFQVAYTSTGDWQNYTHNWPAGSYNIYGRIAGNSPWSGTKIALVTSGVGTSIQTSNVLGSFADPNAAGWQVFHWVPLLETNGSLASITLGGKATLKVICGGGVNQEAYMLVPAAASVTPPASGPTLSAALVSGSLSISIPTQTGHNYQVIYSAVLSSASASWTPVGAAITGDGTTHVVTETLTGAQGYYRVEVQ